MVIIGIKHRNDNRPNLISWAITSWTKSPYTHSEVFIREAGQWYAVGARPDRKGVSRKPATEVVRNPLWWEFYVVPLPDEVTAVEWLLEQCGSGYNWRGVAYSQVLPMGEFEESEWFCSEFAYVFVRLWSSVHLPAVQAASVDPGELRKFLANARVPTLPVLPE